MKTTNSPTQGQPNPRKMRLEVAFGPLSPTVNDFSWVGIGFIQETDYKKPKPPKFSANSLLYRVSNHGIRRVSNHCIGLATIA